MNNYITTPIISEELFKLHSPITQNVDIEDFIPYIVQAQELYMSEILGEPLLSELKEQVSTNELTDLNSSLIIKIAPPLSFYAVYQGIGQHWATIVNKGVTIRESENSKGVSIQDIAQLKKWIKDDAEAFASLLIEYLCKCRSNYPLWQPRNMNCCNDVIHEGTNTKSFDSGFYFPKKSDGCGCGCD